MECNATNKKPTQPFVHRLNQSDFNTISAVTGLLIFFDIEIGLVEPVHKWLSWLLVGGVTLHVIANWKQLTGYFSKKPALIIIGAALVVTIASVMPIYGEREENPGKIAAYALASSSLEIVAQVVKTTPAVLVEQLGKKGIVVHDPSATCLLYTSDAAGRSTLCRSRWSPYH